MFLRKANIVAVKAALVLLNILTQWRRAGSYITRQTRIGCQNLRCTLNLFTCWFKHTSKQWQYYVPEQLLKLEWTGFYTSEMHENYCLLLNLGDFRNYLLLIDFSSCFVYLCYTDFSCHPPKQLIFTQPLSPVPPSVQPGQCSRPPPWTNILTISLVFLKTKSASIISGPHQRLHYTGKESTITCPSPSGLTNTYMCASPVKGKMRKHPWPLESDHSREGSKENGEMHFPHPRFNDKKCTLSPSPCHTHKLRGHSRRVTPHFLNHLGIRKGKYNRNPNHGIPQY